MIFIIECQINAIIAVIKGMIEENAGSVEIKEEEQQKFNREVQELLKSTVWQQGGCKSWYKTEKGEVHPPPLLLLSFLVLSLRKTKF